MHNGVSLIHTLACWACGFACKYGQAWSCAEVGLPRWALHLEVSNKFGKVSGKPGLETWQRVTPIPSTPILQPPLNIYIYIYFILHPNITPNQFQMQNQVWHVWHLADQTRRYRLMLAGCVPNVPGLFFVVRAGV